MDEIIIIPHAPSIAGGKHSVLLIHVQYSVFLLHPQTDSLSQRPTEEVIDFQLLFFYFSFGVFPLTILIMTWLSCHGLPCV